jgi:hypothetical protein
LLGVERDSRKKIGFAHGSLVRKGVYNPQDTPLLSNGPYDFRP